MTGSDHGAAPLLGQVSVSELASWVESISHDRTTVPTEVRRRSSLSRATKRLVAACFLALGITSVVALDRAVSAARSDGLTVEDAVLLGMLAIITSAVGLQAWSLLKALPGAGPIRSWSARRRARRIRPPHPRALLAQDGDVRSLVESLARPRPRSTRARWGNSASTLGWIALTVFILTTTIVGAGVVVAAALRAIAARGWTVATTLTLGIATLLSYGVIVLASSLIRSWFERRRRRLHRLITRLLRILGRGFDRTAGSAPPVGGRWHPPAGPAGRAGLGAIGAAVVVAASLAVPVSAGEQNGVSLAADATPVGPSTVGSDDPPAALTSATGTDDSAERPAPTGDDGLAGSSQSDAPSAMSVTTRGPTRDGADIVGSVSGGPPTIGASSSTAPEPTVPPATSVPGQNSRPDATSATATVPIEHTTTTTTKPTTTTTKPSTTTTKPSTTTTKPSTTTTKPSTTTTTTKPTTTTAKPSTTTTTTTTTVPSDTTGPAVSRLTDGPDPIYTAGQPPSTSLISFTTSDPSGVATVTVYYRRDNDAFAVWSSVEPGPASVTFGPFSLAGTYEYRIMATDKLGNSNCRVLTACPIGTVTAIIP